MQAEFPIAEIRAKFPVLFQKVNGKPLVYLDNAATTQKPIEVINALTEYYSLHNANIHRGAHTLADRATGMFEATRSSIKNFIGADEPETIIFTKGVTESINLVAQTWGRAFIGKGDQILISALEHHSNIVPWQMICQEKEATLKVIPVLDSGELDMDEFYRLLNPKTKLVSVAWASNALGTINPVSEIINAAHKNGSIVLLDGAQAGSHIDIDVQKLDVDFLALSSHKLYGPTGVGVLYGKRSLLEAMPPYQGGGEMIREVTFEETTYNDIPFKFEAGTPNIGDVIAFNKAIEFVTTTGKGMIAQHEQTLLTRLVSGIELINNTIGNAIQLTGTAKDKVAVQSFNLIGKHHFDVGMMLDAKGIAVRTGHHCTQPLMKRFGLEGTVRASFSAYNTVEEVDYLLQALSDLLKR